MTSDQNKCGLSSLLPMSCQERAEAFARSLHSKLRSLSSSDSDGTANENSWLTLSEKSVTASQPRQTNPDLYFEIGDLDSPPGSPEEEIDIMQNRENIINEDSLELLDEPDCHCSEEEETEKESHHLTDISKSTPLCNHFEERNGSGSNANQEIEEIRDEINSRVSPDEYISSIINDTQAVLNLKDSIYSYNNNKENFFSIKNDSASDNNSRNGLENENRITYVSSLSVEKNLTVKYPNEQASPEQWKKQDTINTNCANEDDNEVEEPVPRVRRCSSLKTGKTPPGTPGRKKIVRFADVLGLDLADVRTFLDEIPKVPNSAYNDLKEIDLNDSSVIQPSVPFRGVKVDKVLVPLFQQPGGQLDFIDRVRENQVCLENALVEDPIACCISGTVRVKNLDFHKSVYVRYTVDSWESFSDVQATYVDNSCDGFSDKFYFKLFANTLLLGQKLEFAIRFHCKGCQYWDSNNGINYCFQCLPPAENSVESSLTETHNENWGASLYY